MYRTLVCILVMLSLIPLQPLHAQRHLAVIIAAGEFEANSPYTKRALKGPPNDARLMASLLIWRFGFHPEDILSIGLDQRAREAIHPKLWDGGRYATYEAVKQGFLWASQQASNGQDTVVIYYSGHGTQVYNPNKNDPHVNSEALVPYDTDASLTHLIRDVEIKRWLEAIPSRHKTFIVDSCFSGDMIRMRGDDDPEGLQGSVTSRGLILTEKARVGLTGGMQQPQTLLGSSLPSGTTLLAACESSKKAFEKELIGSANRSPLAIGEFTWALYQICCREQRSLTFSELRALVESRLSQRGKKQVPQLLGGDPAATAIARPPWKSDQIYLPLHSGLQNSAALEIGWLAGIRAGGWLVPSINPSLAQRIPGERIGWFGTQIAEISGARASIRGSYLLVQSFP